MSYPCRLRLRQSGSHPAILEFAFGQSYRNPACTSWNLAKFVECAEPCLRFTLNPELFVGPADNAVVAIPASAFSRSRREKARPDGLIDSDKRFPERRSRIVIQRDLDDAVTATFCAVREPRRIGLLTKEHFGSFSVEQ